MLNTPYEQGWRAAVNGAYLEPHSHAGFVNGYRDAVRNGYASEVTRPSRPAALERKLGFWARIRKAVGL